MDRDPFQQTTKLTMPAIQSKQTLKDIFLEELAQSLDNAIVEHKPVTLMGHFNINYLNTNERNHLDSFIFPDGLRSVNKNEPSHPCRNLTLIDYIITDLNVKSSDVVSLNFDKDHFATVSFAGNKKL